MEPLLEPSIWLLLCIVGFVAGFIDAVVGGGGMLTIPTLMASGLPPHMVLGTNKLAATFGSLTASITFYRKKLFDPYFWRYSLIFTAIGAVIGTAVVSMLSTELLEKSLPVIIMCTAVYSLLSKSSNLNEANLPKKSRFLKFKQITQGLVLGGYDGVAGPGTGAFWMTSSTALYKINILHSCGLARSTNFISNFCSLITFLYLGYVNALLGISMGLFMMLGAWVGAHSAIKFGGRFIRPLFILVVVSMSAKLAFDAWM